MNLHDTQPIPEPETAFFSRYRMKVELGRGGMGVVWRAEDTKLHRDVALKFLPDLVVRDREAMADLAAETRRCLDLTHPHIVRVYDLVEEGTRAAISMELVDGASLADRKLQQPNRCFTTAAIGPWIAQLCSALDYAHSKVRIVHRDLKPLNLLVNSAHDLKVVDFGIARSLLNSGTRLSKDVRKSAVSLGYVGPQQLLGEPAAVSDDIYSVGVTIYELLTGKTPFYEGDIITQLREVVPPTMTARRAAFALNCADSIPAAWEETVAACLAKNPADRPRTAGEIAARLGLAIHTSSSYSETKPPIALTGTGEKPTPPRAKKPFPWFATGALAAMVVVAGALFWWPNESPNKTVAPKSNAAAPVVPVPAPAPEFVVQVSPPDIGASVWLGKETDKPVADDGRLALTGLPDGEHSLTVQASGYKTNTSRITVEGGRGLANVTLEPVYATVVVTAKPGTLVTTINARGREKRVGLVPATGPLRADNVLTVGTYLFEFAHPDYADVEQPKVNLVSGRATALSPAQVPLPGEVRVFSVPDGADVLVAGKKVGVTPATIPNQPSGQTLNVEVYLAGYRRTKETFTLKPHETHVFNAGTLVLESGWLTLKITNPDVRFPRTKFRIDGVDVPHKNGRLDSLEVGKRELEIIHPDYEPWKKTVTVNDGKPTAVDVTLVPKPAQLTLAVTGPAAATVTLVANGKPVALKDSRATVQAGIELALEIGAPGFKTDRRKLTFAPNSKQPVTLALEKISTAEFGRPWTVPDLGLILLPVQPGKFEMGSKVGETTERPITKVTLTKPYWLGKTEVAQAEWKALMPANPAQFQGDNLPVENVSWIDAMEFCNKLTNREKAADRLPAGYVYTLPTEAQWEFACRAGALPDAPENIETAAWHGNNSGETTHPVGTKTANAWGFHDMHGNVWEWCYDRYAATLPGGSPTDPKGPAAGYHHVRRGGSYSWAAFLFRYASRGTGDPALRTFNLGFRVALAPAP